MAQQSDSVIAVIVVFFVVSWIAVGLRFYTRTTVNKGLGVDDALIGSMQVGENIFSIL